MRTTPDTYPGDRVPLLARLISLGAAACIGVAALATVLL